MEKGAITLISVATKMEKGAITLINDAI